MFSVWNWLAHPHSKSPHNQLWLLDGGFRNDAFVYYESWSEDNSIVYRITTNTASINKLCSYLTPIKANYVFLKVQLPTPNGAYVALKENAPSAMLPPDDFRQALADKNFVTASPISKAFEGSYIRTFVERNEDKILIERREYKTMRVYTIVWAPNGEECRLKGMNQFIQSVLGGELNMDNWSNGIHSASSAVGGS
ncbi:hypothetical protein EDB81DRAFT_898316 [Dactylonectria macrodidyma]|uniref:Uncharacterized protein n=1 Tax=Dactylonectria macrodidyma TaxID=307937 RepID=A0A9P9FV75_9HYPO|nr:hypothetical protein EDB81DRAFT_898316 [Dactylonectria macrodidyma]